MPKRENTTLPDELHSARFWVKWELEAKHLPILPDLVEERLFLQGRTPWTYRYFDLKVEQLDGSKTISFNTVALLKKEFHRFLDQHRFAFHATSVYDLDMRKLTVTSIQPVASQDVG